MKTILISSLCAAIVTLLCFMFASQFSSQKYSGVQTTTILGSDTLSATRTVLNKMFADYAYAINKFSTTTTNTYTSGNIFAYASTSQLTANSIQCYGSCSFGATATSSFSGAGALTLITPLTVPNGGTASTTLSSNQVLLGNGASAIKVVSGFGSAGQFLTSGGAGAAPTWTSGSLDTTLNFNWTGTNYFKNFNASSTAANPFYLNGLAYDTPAARAASSTVLQEDGNGHLKFLTNNPYPLALSSAETSTNGTAILATIKLPGGTLTQGNQIELQGRTTGVGASCATTLGIGSGSATTTISMGTDQEWFRGILSYQSASSGEFYGISGASTVLNATRGVLTYNSASPIYISIQGAISGGTCYLLNYSALLYRNQ